MQCRLCHEDVYHTHTGRRRTIVHCAVTIGKRTGRYVVAWCLPNGSDAVSGDTWDEARARARAKIPGCYDVAFDGRPAQTTED